MKQQYTIVTLVTIIIMSVGIIGCPWLKDNDNSTEPVGPDESSASIVSNYELRNFQALDAESDDWCIWIEEREHVFLNVPETGDYLFTLTTGQATFHIVARVYRAATLIVWLQTDDWLIAATGQSGVIHAPGADASETVPVDEREYSSPTIWPAAPYVTLFAWPAKGGIGPWDQIFRADPNAAPIFLAETREGNLALRSCPSWQPLPPAPTPTSTPTPRSTATPGAVPTTMPTPTMTPTSTPTATPTVNPCIVTTEADSGPGSLRQVLAQNSCCTTITFTNAVDTIALGGTELTVGNHCTNLTIDGSGGASGRATIDGNDASHVMAVDSGAVVTLDALTITGGNADRGGGIYNEGILTIMATTTVSHNTAIFAGGGILNDHGTLTVNGIVSHNTVSGNVNSGGGGIWNDFGTVTVNGTVSNNFADNAGGGIMNFGVPGTVGGTVTVSGTVSNNVARNGGGVASGSGTTLTLSGTVTNNTANNSGGGISTFGTLTLNAGHLIQGNHCDNDNDGFGDGGGIWDASGTCPVGANYGTGNYRGSGTSVIDNCNGNP